MSNTKTEFDQVVVDGYPVMKEHLTTRRWHLVDHDKRLIYNKPFKSKASIETNAGQASLYGSNILSFPGKYEGYSIVLNRERPKRPEVWTAGRKLGQHDLIPVSIDTETHTALKGISQTTNRTMAGWLNIAIMTFEESGVAEFDLTQLPPGGFKQVRLQQPTITKLDELAEAAANVADREVVGRGVIIREIVRAFQV